MLTERKKQILNATVSRYIQTAEPVGSKSLLDAFDVSSATVRQALHELEDEGFLTHVHTSSGRVPTDKGYRFYVDELMATHSLSTTEYQVISEQIHSMSLHVETALTQISSVMSSLIDYTTIVMVPTIYQDALKLVHMVLVDINRVLVILLHAIGVNHEFILTLDEGVNQEDLNRLSQLLSSKLEGINVQDIPREFFIKLITDLPDYKSVLTQLATEIDRLNVHHQRNHQLILNGTSKMLKLPEFKNIEFTQQVLAAVEENKVLLELLNRSLSKKADHSIFIGKSDHQVDLLDGCSVVLQPVTLGHSYSTVIGVLGPTRMPYSVVASKLNTLSAMVSEYLTQSISKGGNYGSPRN